MEDYRAEYRHIDPDAAVAGNRMWWDDESATYYDEHGQQLGDVEFSWGPEGLTEATAELLGPLVGSVRILEIGCGGAQCSRWLVDQGAHAVGVDISHAQLRVAHRINAATQIPVPVAQCDARALPFAAGSFTHVCSAYGALPFVEDIAGVFAEVKRVLVPGGRWVFSVTHPIRWAFPDEPGVEGLSVARSYFDTAPYVEIDAAGVVQYAEYHRTLSQWLTLLIGAGFAVVDVREPEWTDPRRPDWGGWSQLRAKYLPGTLILSCRS